eukprot:CAMPEP_0168472832 /NCGR_PEP_ID=MMETSP0228-20121227/60006_1 /TAXON_ID=133427 /ORGANISM="Protoceratium reticulatum, Strain CCCM 535 (=CCMP 1889)" /LENGTH=450 /DNA_ID=CAMNT_0008488795 /DNA_START=20 /DNA_END=1372 /DNA_ORIENTATION=+
MTIWMTVCDRFTTAANTGAHKLPAPSHHKVCDEIGNVEDGNLRITLEEVGCYRDRVRGEEMTLWSQLVELALQARNHLGVVGCDQMRHKDGHSRRPTALDHLAHEVHRSEQRAPGVGEVIYDEHVILGPKGLFLPELVRALLEEELLLLPDGLANPDLLDVEDVVAVKFEPLRHGRSVPGVGAVVGEEDVHLGLAGVARLRFELVEEVWHETLHADCGSKVTDGVHDRSLLMELDKQELEGRPPQGREGHTVQGLRWPRQRRHRARCGQQPREVLRRGQINPLTFRIPVRPLAVCEMPTACALHLTWSVPGQHDGNVGGTPPRVLAVVHVRLPLGALVLAVRHGEALQGLQQGQLLEEPSLIHGVEEEDYLAAHHSLPVDLQVGIIRLELLQQHGRPHGLGELLAAQALPECHGERLKSGARDDHRPCPPCHNPRSGGPLVLRRQGALVL